MASRSLYPSLEDEYPNKFSADSQYIETLPDLQNGPASLIKGAKTRIQRVGIENFKVPLRVNIGQGQSRDIIANVVGWVSLEADKKGINMSRLIRSFYAFAEKEFDFAVMNEIVETYLAQLARSCIFVLLKEQRVIMGIL